MSRKLDSALVVVVDDDGPIRAMLCQFLRSEGFRVVGCGNGREAIETISRLHPSAVTLDLHMPGMDGVEVLDRLLSDQGTASVPVVIVSAYASDKRLRSRPQVKAIIQKPFDVDRLFAEVRRAASASMAPV